MRSPSGVHQSGMRGREPVETSAASNSISSVPSGPSTSTCAGPVKWAVPHDDAHTLAGEEVDDVALRWCVMPPMRS
jgi:hypothetical protein